MDRNYYADKDVDWVRVALRKESVDRNLVGCIDRTIDIIVALRKESVDRNTVTVSTLKILAMSLSARRAWIEMARMMPRCPRSARVALRKESVDRNLNAAYKVIAV